MTEEKQPNKRVKKILIIIGALIIAMSVFITTSLYAFETMYSNKAYPNIYLGASPIGGFSAQEFEAIINNFKKDLETKGMRFIYKNKEISLTPHVVAASDPDLTYELYSIDNQKTIQNILSIGRTNQFLPDLKAKLALLTKPKYVYLSNTIFKDNLLKALHDNFKDQEIASKNADLIINDDFSVLIVKEQEGIIPNYQTALLQFEENLETLSQKSITILSQKDIPKITAGTLLSHKDAITSLFINKPELKLKLKDKEWTISKNIYKDWLYVENNQLSFTSEELIVYLKDSIASEIEIPMQEARFQREGNGKVTEFKPSRNGEELDYEKITSAINADFFSQVQNEAIELAIKIVEPSYTTELVNNLGIKELLGKGVSNFKGSPQNRRHNIKVGADTLNGALIAPDEEFSLVGTLGAIDGAHGYLPELVIKGNKTIPEYGGGLCQIGTTLFRAALQSGLPITERRSHSYRVRYYEPAGTDCTIYSPHPDCRFVNDTGNYILIQTYMTETDDLVFEFWGTKDGRSSTMTKPVITSITPPPPTKYIETEDLKEGERKCTENAHDGAHTTFDYTITYADGTLNKDTFESHYRPWQAVCLIGKKKAPEPPNETLSADKPQEASETPSIPITP